MPLQRPIDLYRCKGAVIESSYTVDEPATNAISSEYVKHVAVRYSVEGTFKVQSEHTKERSCYFGVRDGIAGRRYSVEDGVTPYRTELTTSEMILHYRSESPGHDSGEEFIFSGEEGDRAVVVRRVRVMGLRKEHHNACFC